MRMGAHWLCGRLAGRSKQAVQRESSQRLAGGRDGCVPSDWRAARTVLCGFPRVRVGRKGVGESGGHGGSERAWHGTSARTEVVARLAHRPSPISRAALSAPVPLSNRPPLRHLWSLRTHHAGHTQLTHHAIITLCGAPAANQVREELLKIRNSDEFADDRDAFREAVADRLSLQPLYGKPPPVWLHPTFCAAFADHAIKGTSLEGESSAHASFELFALVLRRMLANRALTALFGASLSHADWQTCNALLLALDEAKRLAHRCCARAPSAVAAFAARSLAPLC